MAVTAQPISNKERIVSIDIVRGIALMGIVFVNALGYLTRTEGVSYPLDPYVGLFYDLFIKTKFYCMFSFLFGLGFYIFMSRAEARQAKNFFLFSRRMFALLFIGVLHFLCWWGSVLPFYAILGFPLMLFYKRRLRTILIWVLGLFSLKIIATGIIAIQVTFGISPWEWLVGRAVNGDLISIFGMFLLGLYVGKRNIVLQVQTHSKTLYKVTKVALFLGVTSCLGLIWLFFVPSIKGWLLFFRDINTYSLALFYLSSLFILLQNKTVLHVLKPIANMGKIGLTMYVCQNFLGSLFIYLFGWSAGYTLVQSLYMTIIIIIIEIIGANLYVMKFKQGPLELIWRKMTYGFKNRTARELV